MGNREKGNKKRERPLAGGTWGLISKRRGRVVLQKRIKNLKSRNTNWYFHAATEASGEKGESAKKKNHLGKRLHINPVLVHHTLGTNRKTQGQIARMVTKNPRERVAIYNNANKGKKKCRKKKENIEEKRSKPGGGRKVAAAKWKNPSLFLCMTNRKRD